VAEVLVLGPRRQALEAARSLSTSSLLQSPREMPPPLHPPLHVVTTAFAKLKFYGSSEFQCSSFKASELQLSRKFRTTAFANLHFGTL
jgi:hypothetical protein